MDDVDAVTHADAGTPDADDAVIRTRGGCAARLIHVCSTSDGSCSAEARVSDSVLPSMRLLPRTKRTLRRVMADPAVIGVRCAGSARVQIRSATAYDMHLH
jgi:hypothetical protein